MEAVITSFRRSRHRINHYQMIIEPKKEMSKEELQSLIGKKVVYNTGKKDIKGEITAIHGSKRLRVRFETGMPGQAIGSIVKIE